ncbi:hypothetical protein ACOSP7_026997 [Xanthoceras sorbifolium]
MIRKSYGTTSGRNDREVLQDQPLIKMIWKSYGSTSDRNDRKVLWDQLPIEMIRKKSCGTNLLSKLSGSPTGQPPIEMIRKSYGTTSDRNVREV